MTAMTLYHYYSNRDAILKAVALRGLDAFLEPLVKDIDATPEYVRKPLRAYKLLATHLLSLGRERPNMYLFIFEVSPPVIRGDPQVSRYFMHLFENIKKRIADEKARETVWNDTFLFQVLVNALVIGSLRGREPIDDIRFREKIDRAYDLILLPDESLVESE